MTDVDLDNASREELIALVLDEHGRAEGETKVGSQGVMAGYAPEPR